MSGKILIAPGSSEAVSKYRHYQPVKSMGLEYDESPFPQDFDDVPNMSVHNSMKWLGNKGKEYSLAHTSCYGNRFGSILTAAREAFGLEIVADVDDHFEEVPLGNLGHAAWYGERRRKYRTLLEEADRVTCSTPFLADRFGGVMCPNYVDFSEYAGPRRKKKASNEVVICCPGGQGRAGDYAEIRESLKAALELPNVKVLFVGSFPEWAGEYPVGKVVWSTWLPIDLYPKMLNYLSPDIIVSPMLHNDFNLAKSNLKWLESGAVGACFVGEQWGEYQRTVLNGVTGVLADGESDWTEKLLWLCTEHEKRQEIAAEGAKEIAKNWTWEAVKDPWIQGVLGDGASNDRLACSSG